MGHVPCPDHSEEHSTVQAGSPGRPRKSPFWPGKNKGKNVGASDQHSKRGVDSRQFRLLIGVDVGLWHIATDLRRKISLQILAHSWSNCECTPRAIFFLREPSST
jgi:hypothetical protein